MNKEHIIKEIQRTPRENSDIPLGIGQFEKATDIKVSDWKGKHWARWGDAVREAGFNPNTLTTAYEENVLWGKYIELTRILGHFPVSAEINLQARNDKSFPSYSTFYNRYKSKAKLISRLAQYCEDRLGYEDIIALCNAVKTETLVNDSNIASQETRVGYVYLIQYGSKREYKIGRTFNPLRREGEIRLQLPEKIEPIHYIETDDPSGIEKYWHNRFADKRKEGEWFALTSADVQAFKKWRRIS